MEFGLSPELKEYQREVQRYLDRSTSPELLRELEEGAGQFEGPHAKSFIRKLGRDGWLGVGWPKEYGGLGKGWWEQYLFFEQLQWRGLPFPIMECVSLAPTLMRIGTEEQKREFLPRILRGEIRIAIGYTEPNAGTDLASLQTRAVRDGDGWVINGQKVFTTNAHQADFVWLAARTDPEAPKHKGISLFMVDTKTPGFKVEPFYIWGPRRLNATFYEDVRVPAHRLIGGEGMGWKLITNALDMERVALSPIGTIDRVVHDLVQWAKETRYNGEPVSRDPWVQEQLTQMVVEVEVARMFSYRNAWMVAAGEVPYHQASMSKAYAVDLQLRIANIGMQIMGLYGSVERGSKWAALNGRLAQLYKSVRVVTFGGGAREIQLDIIGYKGLGLPRG